MELTLEEILTDTLIAEKYLMSTISKDLIFQQEALFMEARGLRMLVRPAGGGSS
jgi:hypothetical protein